MQPFKTLSIRMAMCAALTLAATTAARAEGVTTTVTGFGTVGGSFTGDSNYVYRHDASEFTGASNQFDIGLESRLGLQARFDFGSGFSVTAQEVARQRGDKAFDLGTEWLYAQYSPNSDLQFRVGRVVLAAFLYSDSRQVGFAVPWFRSPPELYGQQPFNNLDGGQVSWRKNLGPFVLGLQASFGNAEGVFQAGPLTITSHAQDIFNASVKLEYGNVLLRVAQTNLAVPTSLPLSATYSVNYRLHEKFSSVGLQYDDGKAVLLSEWAKSAQNNAPVVNEPLAISSSWYVGGGWRFGKFLPFALYSRINEKQSLLYAPATFGTWSATLRYDWVSNVALKAEISHPKANNAQYFISPSPTAGGSVNVYSLGADFVF